MPIRVHHNTGSTGIAYASYGAGQGRRRNRIEDEYLQALERQKAQASSQKHAKTQLTSQLDHSTAQQGRRFVQQDKVQKVGNDQQDTVQIRGIEASKEARKEGRTQQDKVQERSIKANRRAAGRLYEQQLEVQTRGHQFQSYEREQDRFHGYDMQEEANELGMDRDTHRWGLNEETLDNNVARVGETRTRAYDADERSRLKKLDAQERSAYASGDFSEADYPAIKRAFAKRRSQIGESDLREEPEDMSIGAQFDRGTVVRGGVTYGPDGDGGFKLLHAPKDGSGGTTQWGRGSQKVLDYATLEQKAADRTATYTEDKVRIEHPEEAKKKLEFWLSRPEGAPGQEGGGSENINDETGQPYTQAEIYPVQDNPFLPEGETAPNVAAMPVPKEVKNQIYRQYARLRNCTASLQSGAQAAAREAEEPQQAYVDALSLASVYKDLFDKAVAEDKAAGRRASSGKTGYAKQAWDNAQGKAEKLAGAAKAAEDRATAAAIQFGKRKQALLAYDAEVKEFAQKMKDRAARAREEISLQEAR